MNSNAAFLALFFILIQWPFLSLHCIIGNGTLVTVVPSDKGTIFCADQREWNPLEGAKDGVKKIYFIGDTAGYAISGVDAISTIENSRLVPHFSVTHTVNHFFEQPANILLSHTVLQRFAETFAREFKDASDLYNSKIQAPPGATDDVVTEIDFVYLNLLDAVEVERFEFHTDGQVTLDEFSGKQFVTGQTDVTLRIIRPQQFADVRFSDLLGDPRIGRVWLQGTPGYPTKPSVEDVLYFSHLLIKATHERSTYLSNSPVMVGSTCDCAIVEPETGIRWLEESHDTTRR